MNEFTYQNIFETKGIEYLVIIGFLMLLIPFWLLVNRKAGIRQQIKEKLGVFTASVLKIPGGLFYSKYHSWAYLKPSGEARMGIDDFLVKAIGKFEFIPVFQDGSEVAKGQVIGKLVQNGKELTVKSPVSGKIKNVNAELTENPSLINKDPYNSGWLYSIIPSKWKEETQTYFLADEAINWIQNEVERFKDFLAENTGNKIQGTIPVIYQEGGEIRQDILSELNATEWKAFQEEFL